MTKLLTIIFSFIVLAVSAKKEDYVVKQPLHLLWMDYNEDLETFLPIDKGIFKKKKVAHVLLKQPDTSQYLVFSTSSNTQLFIDNKLFGAFKSDSVYEIQIKQFSDFYDSKNLILTFYNEKGELPLSNFFLGEKKPSLKINRNNFLVLGREVSNHVVVILFILLGGMMLAFVKRSKPITYSAYFDVTMHFKNIEEHVVFNSFSKTGLLMPVIISVIVAASLNLSGLSFFGSGINSLALKISFDTLILLFFLFAKFFYLGFLSWLLSIRGIRRVHYFEFVRMCSQYSTFLFLFVLIDVGVGGLWFSPTVIISVIFSFLLTFKLIIVLNRVHKFSNLFLFFYFCTAEVFPLFILVKQLA